MNVLISLFSSAYSDVSHLISTLPISLAHLCQVVDDAEAEYLVFFAGKTVGMIRAPDSYVYPAPFNLIELVFVAPFEYVLVDFSGTLMLISVFIGCYRKCRYHPMHTTRYITLHPRLLSDSDCHSAQPLRNGFLLLHSPLLHCHL